MWFEQLVAYIELAEAPSVAFLRKFVANEGVFAERDATGNSLLHYYCQKHPLDAAILCLFRAMQCDFSAGNSHGVTPLHLMLQNSSVTVALLEIAGGDYAATTRDGYTPLHHYCLQPHFDWLLQRSDPAAVTISRNTVAHLLAMNKAVPLLLISDFMRRCNPQATTWPARVQIYSAFGPSPTTMAKLLSTTSQNIEEKDINAHMSLAILKKEISMQCVTYWPLERQM